ncbi:MAG: aspartate--ammonia ligase [Sphingobacteriales bacterium]|jgi:aspartate--ammonia ligase
MKSLQFQQKISSTKKQVISSLEKCLNLTQVQAPLFLPLSSGLNDNLNGIEGPIQFTIGAEKMEIVHSLAKWKRWALGQLEAKPGQGIITDMKAIRKDEDLSDIHSHFVDQWDWEKVITKEERSLDTLKETAAKIYESVRQCAISEQLPIAQEMAAKLTFIHSQELSDLFPALTPKEREDAACKKYGAVFLIGIGGKLSDGSRHDLRAPDYDDWSTLSKDGFPGLNGDILVWHPVRQKCLELSSMGVRVDKKALQDQLKELGLEERLSRPFHTSILADDLPLSIGGGIGQSRVIQYLMDLPAISEVQADYFAVDSRCIKS